MGETTDQLRQEVDRKRDDAAHKIDEIEQRMSDTVTNVQEGVKQTTEQVKATVQDGIQGAQDAVGQTAQQVTEQVKHTAEQVKANMDWRKQIDERPLVMVGAAFLGGFVLGSLAGGDGDDRPRRAPDQPGYPYGGPLYGIQYGYGSGEQRPPQPQPTEQRGAAPAASGGGGVMDSLRGMLQQAGLQESLTTTASAFVNSFGDKIRATLEEQVPGFKEQMQKQSEQGGQGRSGSGPQEWSSQSGPSGTSSDAGIARQVDPAERMDQDAGAATTDAAGRTAPYFGDEESRQGGATSP